MPISGSSIPTRCEPCGFAVRAQLAAAVSAYRKALLAREENPPGEDLPAREARIAHADRELNVQAAKLGGLLLPLHPSSGIHRLVVIPDNIVASVPFSALRLGTGDGLLIENYEVTEEPSAAVAMELLSRPAAFPNREAIAVFADPVYNLLDPRLARCPRRSFGRAGRREFGARGFIPSAILRTSPAVRCRS